MSNSRPGGRSADVQRRVFEATRAAMSKKQGPKPTMLEIARRANVAVTSLYRRWGAVETLMLEAASDRLATQWPLPNEGSLRADLEKWAGSIAIGLQSQDDSSFLKVLSMTWNANAETRSRALSSRTEQLENMLQQAQQRGERAPAVVDLIDFILGPLYVRWLLGQPTNPEVAIELVDRLIQRC